MMQALVINPPGDTLPEGTTDLLDEMGWKFTTSRSFSNALAAARTATIDVVIMPEPTWDDGQTEENGDFHVLMKLIDARRIAAFLVTDQSNHLLRSAQSLIDIVGRDIPLAELRGRLSMVERYHALFKRMERELHNMEQLSNRLNDQFREVDQEMRLAARLQRDFLPQLVGPISNVRFATVYRPASWVSGDLYDVFRIDEEHTGFYVADAVGHGIAASLLTMFIKRSIVPKRVQGEAYTVLSPSKTLASLNDALVDQSLPNCQFVTICYALLNHRTLTLRCARGGHPYPLLLQANGIIRELKISGGLLGLFRGEEFPTFETHLDPGDKLLLYTDGVELAFQSADGKPLDKAAYHRVFGSLASLPIQEMMTQVEAGLNDEAGSLNPRDDITIVGLEILKD